MIVERSADVKATPAKIWSACFATFEWEKWDPDLEKVEDAPEGGLAGDATITFVMKEGPVKRLPTSVSGVKENESLTFSGSTMGGMMRFAGTVVLTAKDEATTTIDYTFEMAGCLGSVAGWLGPDAIVGGTEKGLAAMKEPSEA